MNLMESSIKRRWYLVYGDERVQELNRSFNAWFDSKTTDHHFEQVVRCFPSLKEPCICAEHYGNIDCVPVLSTVFFISNPDTTAVNRSWIDTYSMSVNENSSEITPREFNNMMHHCTGFPIAKYNILIPSETESGLDMTFVSFYKGVLGGLCTIEKIFHDRQAHQASLAVHYPWEGTFHEASNPARLDDNALAQCVIEHDFDGNGYLRPLASTDLLQAKEQCGHLYEEFLID